MENGKSTMANGKWVMILVRGPNSLLYYSFGGILALWYLVWLLNLPAFRP
jgi:hypothetical protein